MAPTTVAKLEAKIEEAIIEVVLKMGLKKLLFLPSHPIFQMMAKAAVAIYEATVENRGHSESS